MLLLRLALLFFLCCAGVTSHRRMTIHTIPKRQVSRVVVRSQRVVHIQRTQFQAQLIVIQQQQEAQRRAVLHFLHAALVQRALAVQRAIQQRLLAHYIKIQMERRRKLIAMRLITAQFQQFHVTQLQSQQAMLAISQSQTLYRFVILSTIMRNLRVSHLVAHYQRIHALIHQAWITRYVMAIQMRQHVTFRSFLLGVRGWMTATTNIAVAWVKSFVHLKINQVLMQQRRVYFLTLFHNMQAHYAMYARYIHRLVIGKMHFNGYHLVQRWAALYNVVYKMLLGQINVRAFIVQIQIYPSYLNILRVYIIRFATMYKAQVLHFARYRMQLQALFYFYSRVYLLSMIRQSVIAGGYIHSATLINMQNSLIQFYKLIEIYIHAPINNPSQHPTLPPIKPPVVRPPVVVTLPPVIVTQPPVIHPKPPVINGGHTIEGKIEVNINGKKKSVDINSAPQFVTETLAIVKKSMSSLIQQVVSGSSNLKQTVDMTYKVSGNLHVLVTVYSFVREHQKQLFTIYNNLKDRCTDAFDFLEKTVSAQIDKYGTQTKLLKSVGDKIDVALQLYDLMRTGYVGSIEDKQNYVTQFDKLFGTVDKDLKKAIQSGLKASETERKGIGLVAPVYALTIFEKLTVQAWKTKTK